MDSFLWKKIEEFDLDYPASEYGFSTRLASENFWTISFAKKAIIEYKKFMYLAGTSGFMVSPSEIVDAVWHQHLIFTMSYMDLCTIIGKNIQHIPSTHNEEDAEKFRQAKERTQNMYSATFGDQPPEIWNYTGMYEALELPKPRIKTTTVTNLGLLAFILLIWPFYFLLKPLYIHIDNPYFLVGYSVLMIFVLAGLEIYNQSALDKIVSAFRDFTFIHHLQPSELVYAKTQHIENVIHGHVNMLIQEKRIAVNKDETLQLTDSGQAGSIEAFTILETVRKSGKVPYPALLNQLIYKPVFTNVVNTMDAFQKYFMKSKAYARVYYLNFGILLLVVMAGLIRLSTGVAREKPVTLIFIVLVIFTVGSIAYMLRLAALVCTSTIPKLYTSEIVPAKQDADAWRWQYFLIGNAALADSFFPIVKRPGDAGSSMGGGGDGSSCGAGCGSSCSSCGGCGGGD